MTGLPPLVTAGEFSAWRTEPARWLPAALDIAAAHRVSVGDLHIFTTGTNLVLGLGEHLVLKLFPPPFRSQFMSERATLRQLRGRLAIPTPEIVHEGEREQWSYLIMTRLKGVVGSEIWPDLPDSSKQTVLREIGETIAQVQRVSLGEIALVEPGWPDFMARQIASCRARHIRLGLPEKYWDELDALISAAPTLIPMHEPAVILTGEYIPENFLLEGDGDDWQLAGVFDFGDVLAGWGEYDLLGPSAFMTAGRPELVRSLLKGFGQPDGAVDPLMRQRLLTLTFLHRASDPLRKIAIEDWPSRAATLLDLGRMLWPIDRV